MAVSVWAPAKVASGGVSTSPMLTSPPARRLRQPSWLDLRLVLGLLLVLMSVVLGARALAAADTSSQVWAVSGDLAAGTTLTADDVRLVRVRLFTDAGRYLGAAPSPAGRTLTRRLGGGELLPKAALTDAAPGRLVSLPVSSMHAPDSLRRGQRIDVFASSKGGGAVGTARTTRILAGVPVQAVRTPQGGLSSGVSDYAVLVRVAPDAAAAVIAAMRTSDIDVTVVTEGNDGPTS